MSTLNIDQGIHKVKLKVSQNEKRKKLYGFSFYINIGKFKAFLRNLNLSANRLFWRCDILQPTLMYILKGPNMSTTIPQFPSYFIQIVYITIYLYKFGMLFDPRPEVCWCFPKKKRKILECKQQQNRM